MDDLRGHVVVITGASSGIGRLSSLEFARAGAHVVAAARNEHALATLEAEASAFDGTIETVRTDVTDEDAVRALATLALERHGWIDTWINGAGIALWARANETTLDEYRRMLQVNVLGVVAGTLAALDVMSRRDRGTIINIGSVESMRAMPLQAAYAASKHAVKGFTEAVRAELEHDGRGIKLVLVMPSAINTPIFRHARSRLGVMPRPHPPVYDPRVVADALLALAVHPVPRIVIGGAGAGLVLLQRISPRLADRALRLTGWTGQHSELPDDGADILDAPDDAAGAVRGAWSEGSRGTSIYTRVFGLHPTLRAAATLAAGIGALAALWRGGRR